ncbi:MFS transporter [Brevibacillus nitrificans]|uniref:MFS transporter n=1 Tax=Brevibacillus nitrificans TaxID=651560 RepID=A0A3M8DKZ7_9BACL|nr:MFS transporter [Brevibacillus nitrificans]RNB88760.1 MFS transporter [Brevibacillus nitrificans]
MIRVLWAILLVAVSTNFPSPFFPIYAAHYGLTNFEVTALFATYAACLLPLLLLAGPVGERIGMKRVAFAALVMTVISAGIFLVANRPWMLYVARAAEGIAVGAFMGTGNALLLRHSPYRTSVSMTLSGILTMVGFGLGPLICGAIIQYSPWMPEKLPYLLLLLGMGSAAGPILSLRDQEPHTDRHQAFRIRLGIPAESRRLFWSFVAPAAFTMLALNGVVISLIPAYVRALLHSTNLAVPGLLLFVFFGGAAVAQCYPKPEGRLQRIQTGIACLIAGTWMMIMAGSHESMGLLWLGMALMAIGNGWVFQACLQLVGKMGETTSHARAISTFYVAAYLGMAFPTIGVGMLSTMYGLMPALIGFGMLVTVIGLGILVSPVWLEKRKIATSN